MFRVALSYRFGLLAFFLLSQGGCLIALVLVAVYFLARENYAKRKNLPVLEELPNAPPALVVRTNWQKQFWFTWTLVPSTVAVILSILTSIFQSPATLVDDCTHEWHHCFIPMEFACALYPLSMLVTGYLIYRIINSTEVVHYYADKLFVKSEKLWKTMSYDDIVEVSFLRKKHISETLYNEDDITQHDLYLKNSNGKEITISVTRYDDDRKSKLFEWLSSHVDRRVINAQSKAMLAKYQPVKKLQTPEVLPDLFSLTQCWESDLQIQMRRTNYVPLETGHMLQNGRYTIYNYLNSGGFSTTYLANTTDGARLVVKESVLPANLSAESRDCLAEMFAREAKLLKRCSHKNIAQLLDFFQENGRDYLVLEHIDGAPLSELVRRSGPVAEAQIRLWAESMADFLEYLHSSEPPIIHRDFTPENLLLHRSGELFLIDFGAANEFVGQATGTLIGKQAYIAPEQLRGKAIPESDIYAFGATLYFLLSGREPMPLTELDPASDGIACSAALSDFVRRCTTLDEHDRIKTTQLKHALNELNLTT